MNLVWTLVSGQRKQTCCDSLLFSYTDTSSPTSFNSSSSSLAVAKIEQLMLVQLNRYVCNGYVLVLVLVLVLAKHWPLSPTH